MNWSHIHLIVNHLPVLGTLFALLLLVVGLLKDSKDIQKAALTGFIVTGVCAVVAYLTGNPAEEVVERLPGISEAAIELHEKAAVTALSSAVVLAFAALLALLASVRRPRLYRASAVLVLLLSIAVFGLMGWTANLGGQIRHSEITSTQSLGGVEHDED